jgi:hypothetical protein
MQTTSDNDGKTPEPAPHAFPRWVWLAGAGGMLVIGWLFILIANSFHLTAPVVFVCLGYGAGVAAVYTLFRTGASAVSGDNDNDSDEDEAASWGRPVGARAELEREKRVLLKAIKEAEFDLQMGKLSKADAEAMIASYRAQAIAVIKEIDRKEGVEATAREEIEREVRARLEVMKAKKVIDPDKRSAGKKADKGKRGGAPAKKGEAAKAAEAAAKAEPKGEERILDAAPKAEPAAEAAAAGEKAEEAADAAEAKVAEETAGEAKVAEETAGEAKSAEAVEAKSAEAVEAKSAEAADERAADAAEPEADAAARAAVANDASGALAGAKEATP